MLLAALASCGGGRQTDADAATVDATVEIAAPDVADSAAAADEQKTPNQPPAWNANPLSDVEVYQEYGVLAICDDPEGAAVTVEQGEGHTCPELTCDVDGGTADCTFVAGKELAGTSCNVQLSCSDGELSAALDVEVAVLPLPDIEELGFGKLSPWAEPIQDFIELNTEKLGHANFTHDLFDLAVFEDRLYLGYGDATLNLGQNTPIEVRYFFDPEIPEHLHDFVVDEEQIDRFRIEDNVLLIPGVDATEDGFMGNAYVHPEGGEWTKSRTLEGGWHVHDIARSGEDLFAVGSGGTGDDYANSTVNAFLWKSSDGGETFTVASKIPHPAPPGDHRLTSLLAVAGNLYATGYYSANDMTYATAYEWTDGNLTPWAGLGEFFVMDSYPISPKLGLMNGVRIEQPLRYGVKKVTGAGVAFLTGLDGKTLIDAEPLGDGRALLLYLDGDPYPPAASAGGYELHVALLSNGSEVTERLSGLVLARPSSVAFWRKHLFVGLSDGTLWRAVGSGQ
jgi:hypothetical protein